MPYVEGRGWKMGLQFADELAEARKEQAYLEDRARAMAQAQADMEADRIRFDDAEGESASKAPGALPEGAAGPYSVEEQRVHDRFAAVRAIRDRMSPEHRQRWLEEEQVRMQRAALDRARQRVASDIQDRLQRGGYSFLDEEEPNEAVMARVEQLMQALDSDQIDPLKAAELDAKILDTVKLENERRLEIQRGDQMLEQRLTEARGSGNPALAQRIESIKAMWGTGQLKADDLIDHLFEATYGRKTERAGAANPFQVRKEAMRLWETYETTPPTEEGLQKYIELLSPAPPPEQEPTGLPEARQKGREAASSFARDRALQGRQAAPQAGHGAQAPQGEGRRVPRQAGLVGRKPSELQEPSAQPPARASGSKTGDGGWGKLTPAKRKSLEQQLTKILSKPGDPKKSIRRVLSQHGLTAIPRSLLERLKQVQQQGAFSDREAWRGNM